MTCQPPNPQSIRNALSYGRGGKVGRGLGVGVDRAPVAVAVAVGVADAAAVAVAVAVGVGEAAPQGLTGQLKISIDAMMVAPSLA